MRHTSPRFVSVAATLGWSRPYARSSIASARSSMSRFFAWSPKLPYAIPRFVSVVAVHGTAHDVEEPRVARRRLVHVFVLRFHLGSRAALERRQVQGRTALAHIIHNFGIDLARLLSDLVQRVERRGRRAGEAALLALVADVLPALRNFTDCALDLLVRNLLN